MIMMVSPGGENPSWISETPTRAVDWIVKELPALVLYMGVQI